jgi:hypothetical protein
VGPCRAGAGSRASLADVDGFAFEGEHAEDTFVDSVERFAGDESFESAWGRYRTPSTNPPMKER